MSGIANMIFANRTPPAVSGGGSEFLAVYGNASDYLNLYSVDTSNLTTPFTKLSNPPSIVTGTNYGGGGWDSAGNFFMVHNDVTPFVHMWTHNGSGTLTKQSAPASLPLTTTTDNGALSPDGAYVALPTNAVGAFDWYSNSGGTLTKLTNPATMPVAPAWGLCWKHNSQRLFVCQDSAPYFRYYSVSGTTLTNISSPFAGTTAPTGRLFGAAWNPAGTKLAVMGVPTGTGSGNKLTVYADNGNDTFTQEYTYSLSSQLGIDVSWNHDGSILIAGRAGVAQPISVSGSTYTLLSALPSYNVGVFDRQAIDWSSDGKIMTVKGNTSPFLVAYSVSGTTFTRITTPWDVAPTVGNYGFAKFSRGSHSKGH
jgi:hypothetical protein